MNRYEAFPDVGGAAMRRRDHRLSRQRTAIIGGGTVLLIGAVSATGFFGTPLMRKQANTTWGVITAVSAPAAYPAMAASLAAKRASFTTSAPAQTESSSAVSASSSAPAPAPAVAAASPAPATASASSADAAPTPTPPVSAPASIAEASKMMDTAALADRPVKESPVAAKLPSLTVAPTIHAAPGQAAAFAVSVNDDGVLPNDSRISIHGIPQEVALSAGHRDATGDWMLSPGDLSSLTVTPADTTIASTSDLLVQLKTADGKVANEWHTVLNVTPAAPVAKPADQVAGFAVTEKASPDDIKSWMSHGRDLERVGYLAGARLFYQRAAEAGSAEGARAMAATYDPAVFAKLGVHGLEPDPVQAQKWYERAKVLEAKSGTTQSGTVP